MIPGSFDYHRPSSVQEAVGLLAKLGEDARAIAGGHSLIPMMKLRLATPTDLVDLGGISDLKGIKADGGDVVIGAMTTQHELIGAKVIHDKLPILVETAELIADPQVRYVGTVGGNVANGDPGNDMPAVMMCLGASYHIIGKSGERKIAARDFYQGAYFTALEPGEIVTAVRIPAPPVGHGYAYEKLKRKVGDYATAAAAVILTVSGGKVGKLLHRPHQCGRNAAVGGRGKQNPHRLQPRRRHREEGGRRRGEDHLARQRSSRHAAIPHQDGGRHAHPCLGPRQATRQRMIPKKPVPGSIGDGNRFSEKIMRNQRT